jgi:hypothetical protein
MLPEVSSGRLGKRLEQIHLIAAALTCWMMVGGIRARCCGTLSNDHDQTSAGNGKERFHVFPAHIRQTQMRQATGHGAENGDTPLRPVKVCAGRDSSGNHKESSGQLGGKAMEEEDTRYNYK